MGQTLFDPKFVIIRSRFGWMYQSILHFLFIENGFKQYIK